VNIWRMKLRAGDYGDDMWPQCREQKIASMTHPPIFEMDLTRLKKREVPLEVKTAARTSIWRFAWDITSGDMILVGDSVGKSIIARGFVSGPIGERAYRYNDVDPIREPSNAAIAWRHEVPVTWDTDFVPFTYHDGAPRITVMHYESEWAPTGPFTDESTGAENASFLNEGAYLRDTPAFQKNVKRLHASLSNTFRRWLAEHHGIVAVQEKNRVDIRFSSERHTHLAELKICYGSNTKAAIREALGQTFEYNVYPPRTASTSWLIVLDTKPNSEDLTYVNSLRDRFTLPITLVWCINDAFESDRDFLL
jgi:hypothetical protein